MRMVKAKYHAQTQCRYAPYSGVVDAPWPFRRYNLFCNWHYRQPVETNHYVNKFENLLLVMLRVLFFFLPVRSVTRTLCDSYSWARSH